MGVSLVWVTFCINSDGKLERKIGFSGVRPIPRGAGWQFENIKNPGVGPTKRAKRTSVLRVEVPARADIWRTNMWAGACSRSSSASTAQRVVVLEGLLAYQRINVYKRQSWDPCLNLALD